MSYTGEGWGALGRVSREIVRHRERGRERERARESNKPDDPDQDSRIASTISKASAWATVPKSQAGGNRLSYRCADRLPGVFCFANKVRALHGQGYDGNRASQTRHVPNKALKPRCTTRCFKHRKCGFPVICIPEFDLRGLGKLLGKDFIRIHFIEESLEIDSRKSFAQGVWRTSVRQKHRNSIPQIFLIPCGPVTSGKLAEV